jgi:ABC-type transport system involved in multi-copper enzyme maturation permease subunit
MEASTSTLLKRVGLAIIGQALPETSALEGMVKSVRRGLLATVVTGVLFGALLLLGCFGFYTLLISEGLSGTTAIVLSAGFLALMSIISGLIAEKHLSKVSKVKKKLSPLEGAAPEVNIELLFSAFINGLCETDVAENTEPKEKQQATAHGAYNGHTQKNNSTSDACTDEMHH